MLGRTTDVAIASTATGLTLTVPTPLPGEIDRVVVMEMEK